MTTTGLIFAQGNTKNCASFKLLVSKTLDAREASN